MGSRVEDKQPRVQIKQRMSKQLLVEGKDQKNFFETFIKHLTLQGIQVHNFGGRTELKSFLQLLVNAANFETVSSIGIIRDAEECAQSVFQSVQSSLRNLRNLRNGDLPVPSAVGKRSDGRPAVTVLILPDGANPGMLETLLCESFAGDPVNRCIDNLFECVDPLPDTSSDRRDKARAHVYLATKPHPEVSVGVAAQKDYWCLDHEVFSDVRNFFKGL